MARDTNGTQTVKKPHGIVMKVQIQSGNVSKRETIEALTESARTGKLSANTMVKYSRTNLVDLIILYLITDITRDCAILNIISYVLNNCGRIYIF